MHPLTALQASDWASLGPKSKCWQGQPQEAPGQSPALPLPPSFRWLLSPLAQGHITLTSISICVFNFLPLDSYMDASPNTSRGLLLSASFFTVTFAETLSPCEASLKGSGLWDLISWVDVT